jgi:hypothetical protein
MIDIKKFKEQLSKNQCPFCDKELKYYDGCLGYEAMKCSCGFFIDNNGMHFDEV